MPQIDYLVELAQLVIGKTGGARMTGGGFGGCIVALAPHDKVEAVRKIIADNYEKQTGLKEDFYVCTASQGVSLCIEKTVFNAPDGQPYQLVQLTNSNGMTVQFMDWGATWLSCKVPMNGELREVLLGCKVEDYSSSKLLIWVQA